MKMLEKLAAIRKVQSYIVSIKEKLKEVIKDTYCAKMTFVFFYYLLFISVEIVWIGFLLWLAKQFVFWCLH